MDRKKKFTSLNRKSGPINTLTSGNPINYSSNLINIDSRPIDPNSDASKSSTYLSSSKYMVSISSRINNQRINNRNSDQNNDINKNTLEEIDDFTTPINLIDDEINEDLPNKLFKINKIIIKSGEGIKTKVETINNLELDLQITHSSLKIVDELVKTRIILPYHRIIYIKSPELNKSATISRILFVLKEPLTIKLQEKQKEIIELCINLKTSWNMDEFKENLVYNEKSNIDKALQLKRFSIQEATDYCDSLPFESRMNDETYKGSSKFSSRNPIVSATSMLKSLDKLSTKLSTKSSTKSSKKASNLKPDMSSLNRKERLHRTRSTILYQNEDLEEEMANEQMVMDNGDVKISDYIPPERQIYFQPNLKYKLNNKKTFTITNDDFKCLYNGNWINDTLVDFFISYSLEIARHSKVPKANKIEILNSFFFTSLSRPIDDDNYYQNVKSWFKSNNDLFDQEYVIIPIMQDLHWYFIIITGLKYLKRRHLKLKEKRENSETSETEQYDQKHENNEENNNNYNDENNEISEDGEIDERDENNKTIVNTKDNKNHDNSNSSQSDDPSKINNENNDIEMLDDGENNVDEKVNLVSKGLNDKDVEENFNGLKIDPREDFEDPEKPDKEQGRTAQICILDSLRRNHEQAITYLKHFIIGYASEKYNIDIKANEISKKVCLVPQQKNFNDCGVHVLFNVDTMLNDPTEFNKVILKRSTNKKNIAKARMENRTFFDSNKRLYLRDKLRDLLLNLLKMQVKEQGGDVDEVGTLTVHEKELLDLRSGLIKNEVIDDDVTVNKKSNKKSSPKSGINETQKNKDDIDKDESDDDLMIIHVEEKEPIKPELELDKVIPATEPLKPIRGREKPKSERLQKSKSEPMTSNTKGVRSSPRKLERRLIDYLSHPSSDDDDDSDEKDRAYEYTGVDSKTHDDIDSTNKSYRGPIKRIDKKYKKNADPFIIKERKEFGDGKENKENAFESLHKDILQVKIPKKRGRPKKNIEDQKLARSPIVERRTRRRTKTEDEIIITPSPPPTPPLHLSSSAVSTQQTKRKYKKRKTNKESDISNYEQNLGNELFSQDSYPGSPTRYNYQSSNNENVDKDPSDSQKHTRADNYKFESMKIQEDIENELKPSQVYESQNIFRNNNDDGSFVASTQADENEKSEIKRQRTPDRNINNADINNTNNGIGNNSDDTNHNHNQDDYALSPIVLTGKVDPVYSAYPVSSPSFDLQLQGEDGNLQDNSNGNKHSTEPVVVTKGANLKNTQKSKPSVAVESMSNSFQIDIPIIEEGVTDVKNDNKEGVLINSFKFASAGSLKQKPEKNDNQKQKAHINEGQNENNISMARNDPNSVKDQKYNIDQEHKDNDSKDQNKNAVSNDPNDSIKNYNFRGTTVATNLSRGSNSTNPIALDGPQDPRFMQKSENIQKSTKTRLSKKDIRLLSQKIFSKPNNYKTQNVGSSLLPPSFFPSSSSSLSSSSPPSVLSSLSTSSSSLIPQKLKIKSMPTHKPEKSSKENLSVNNLTRSSRRTRSSSPLDLEVGKVDKSLRKKTSSSINTRSRAGGADIIIQQLNNTKKKWVSKESLVGDKISFKGAHKNTSRSYLDSDQEKNLPTVIDDGDLPVLGLADDDYDYEGYTETANYINDDLIVIPDDDEPSLKF